MLKCPYCYEPLQEKDVRCPHCQQFLIDEVISSDFQSLDKKACLFCGKKIFVEAKICRYCQKWLDEIDRLTQDIDPNDLM